MLLLKKQKCNHLVTGRQPADFKGFLSSRIPRNLPRIKRNRRQIDLNPPAKEVIHHETHQRRREETHRHLQAQPVTVFPGRAGEAVQGARGWFKDAVTRAGLTDYTWHCNRHTFASRLVMTGVDLRTVGELLGHRTAQMTHRYTHLAPSHTASAVDRPVTAQPVPEPAPAN
jgi:site-specific recombinase XerD